MGLEDFEVIGRLGKGSFAVVKKVRRLSDNKMYAMKQIQINKLDQKALKNSLNEIRFLASFNNQNIITYHEAFFQQKSSLLCIVMEYAENGDLFNTIKSQYQSKHKNPKMKMFQHNFMEVQIWKLLISLLNGIQYLHQRSILHRDIKPQNVFITKDGQYKLGDLNVSRIQDPNNLAKLTQTGTPYYASPQVWRNQQYDQKSDIWSIGCTVYHMAALRPPFAQQNLQKLYHQVQKSKVNPLPQSYSNQLNQMIQLCLQKDPTKRPSAKQLKNSWIIKMYSNLISHKNSDQKQIQLQPDLLKTINIPQNKSLLQEKLPKSNYKQIKILSQIKQNSIKPSKNVYIQEQSMILNKKSNKNQNKKNKQEQQSNMKPQLKNVLSQKILQRKRRSSPRTELSVSKNYQKNKPKNIIQQNIRSKQNIQFKALIMAKMPDTKITKNKKIVEELLAAKLTQQRVKQIMNKDHRIASRKAIFQRIKSSAIL